MSTKAIIIRNIIIGKVASGSERHTAIGMTRQDLIELGVPKETVKEYMPEAVALVKKYFRNHVING